jgi:hypothetical protein
LFCEGVLGHGFLVKGGIFFGDWAFGMEVAFVFWRERRKRDNVYVMDG